jgi:hypothetical protein
VWRWTIVLPEGIESRLTPEELRALLAHELAHLVRGDAAWLWVGRVICLCLPLQPLNFVARRGWQAAGEFLCDDWAVRREVGAVSLARCLTRVAEWRFEPAAVPALPAAGTPAMLTQRVERLLSDESRADPWEGQMRRRLLPATMLAIAGLCGWLGPRSLLRADAPEPAVAESEGIDSRDGAVPLVEARPAVTPEPRTTREELALLDRELEALRNDLSIAQLALRSRPNDSEIEAILKQIDARLAQLTARQRQLANPRGR